MANATAEELWIGMKTEGKAEKVQNHICPTETQKAEQSQCQAVAAESLHRS